MSRAVTIEDRGFTLGDGVFDTALALGGTLFARARHVERLMTATAAIGIAVSRARIDAAIDDAVTAEPAIIRTTVTRGTAARGLWPATTGTPTVVTSSAPWSAFLVGQPARLITASGRRNEFSPTANLKTLGYLDHILAAREAERAEVDDALLLNTQGRVCCTTIANIFVLVAGRLITPSLAEGALPGVMRALVMEMAPRLGFAVEERPLAPQLLGGADAVFLTNSVRFLRPVTELDGVALATDGKAFAALMDALRERVDAECGEGLMPH